MSVGVDQGIFRRFSGLTKGSVPTVFSDRGAEWSSGTASSRSESCASVICAWSGSSGRLMSMLLGLRSGYYFSLVLPLSLYFEDK